MVKTEDDVCVRLNSLPQIELDVISKSSKLQEKTGLVAGDVLVV